MKLQVDEKRERVWLYGLAIDPTERNGPAERVVEGDDFVYGSD